MSEDSLKVVGHVDVTLVQQAQQGEGEAFAALFNQLHQPVLNYIYHMLGNRQVAEDVAQDAFIRAHERIGQLGPPWDFKSWVFRIASNLAVDYLRGQRRFVDHEEPEMMAGPPTTRRPSERGVQREEVRRAVRQTLDGLPTVYRQALVLREFNGFSYREVSQALECTYDNARQLVHRARLRFREQHGLRMTLEEGVERCRELGDLLSAYHDGEIDTKQRKAVRAHISACPQCRETEEDLKKVGALVAGLAPIWPSEGWMAQVLNQVGIQEVPAPVPGGVGGGAGIGGGGATGGGIKAFMMSGSWMMKVGAVVMASILVMGGLVLASLILSPPPPPPPPSETTQAVTTEPPDATSSAPPSTPAPGGGDVEETSTSTPTSTATTTQTQTATATDGPPIAEANVNSNCRFGPGAVYAIIGTLLKGETAPIDGRNEDWTWWWIERQDGPGHCWIWDALVTVSGDTSAVPLIQAPPPPEPEDTEPPSVSINHSPSGGLKPDETDVVSFTASANDDGGVERIEIWVQAPGASVFSRVTTCQAAATCVYQGGPYRPGKLVYYAKAYDAADNMGESPQSQVTVWATVK